MPRWMRYQCVRGVSFAGRRQAAPLMRRTTMRRLPSSFPRDRGDPAPPSTQCCIVAGAVTRVFSIASRRHAGHHYGLAAHHLRLRIVGSLAAALGLKVHGATPRIRILATREVRCHLSRMHTSDARIAHGAFDAQTTRTSRRIGFSRADLKTASQLRTSSRCVRTLLRGTSRGRHIRMR